MKMYSVLTTSLFNRLLYKLVQQHPELPDIFESAITILKADPHNLSRSHPIIKLRGIYPGNGQYRLRVGRWRFRYDIWDKLEEVELSYCGLRREDTYR
jgi:mRNA-degrading endonuclease RelE of RelBE toxin-antitoxin system